MKSLSRNDAAFLKAAIDVIEKKKLKHDSEVAVADLPDKHAKSPSRHKRLKGLHDDGWVKMKLKGAAVVGLRLSKEAWEMLKPTLSKEEQSRKEKLEGIVDKWLEQALEAGKALMEIKSAKLYRETHSTFEKYVKDRFAKTRQWAFDMVVWYEANHLANTLQNPISQSAATAMRSTVKNSPAKVKKIVAESRKIAKKKGHKALTREDVVEAQRNIIPMPKRKKPAKPQKSFEVSITVDKSNEMELLAVLDGLKAKYTKSKSGLNLMMESVSAFMGYVGKLLDKAEKFEFSIHGEKVETVKKRKSA